jgi:hypothetical protein
MDRVDEYIRQAQECREAAGAATTQSIKAHFLKMADTWEVLARQRGAWISLVQALDSVAKDDPGSN